MLRTAFDRDYVTEISLCSQSTAQGGSHVIQGRLLQSLLRPRIPTGGEVTEGRAGQGHRGPEPAGVELPRAGEGTTGTEGAAGGEETSPRGPSDLLCLPVSQPHAPNGKRTRFNLQVYQHSVNPTETEVIISFL